MSRKKPEKKEISQEWLTTYSDMVTLILTFFVLLYSFSLVDNEKFKAVAASLANALNASSQQTIFHLNENSGEVPVVGEEAPKMTDTPYVDNTDPYVSMYETVTNFVEENSLHDDVTIREGSKGIIIEFKDRILFDTGKARIKDEGVPALMKISELIRNMKNPIVIEGHTDNVPIRTSEFPSNWELSSARALRVLWFMTENRGLDPKRFSTAAYGEYNPITSNDTAEGRAQNRRVNILIVTPREKTENSQQ